MFFEVTANQPIELEAFTSNDDRMTQYSRGRKCEKLCTAERGTKRIEEKGRNGD
jgi:hypothetical protein